ncbi:MAG: serine/threonine protein phosphatase [Acidisphaera sp.]|nr:serine/threonine protein phosphatase [Acidisphaera sp.]
MVTSSKAPGVLAAGRRVYAVGDVHGCADRLAAMHAAIAADLQERPVGTALLIHLGDYVDRGPDSAGVIARLSAGQAVAGARTINLMGNHEGMMLAALNDGDPGAAAHWLDNGGGASLRSWGVHGDFTNWRRQIPPAHLAFLGGLALSHVEGGYLFVHAGIRPGVVLERQSAHDLLWMREPFLSWTGEHGCVVVHGHTPVSAPVVRPNRIGIDTGAVLGGPLTCVVLEADRLHFITQ